MKFNRIIAQDFGNNGGTHLSFEFGAFGETPTGPGVAVSGGTYITAGFPAGEWTQKEVASQLRKLADHLENEINKQEQNRARSNR
jgi:hypothetical protein